MNATSSIQLGRTIPALPAVDVAKSVSTRYPARVDDTDFGTREFATLDRDGNLVAVFKWAES